MKNNGFAILRIYGAILVFGVHLFQVVDCGTEISKLTSVGATGVDLFYVLSGFLIFKSLESNNMRDYIYKRVTSVYVPYLLMVFIWFLYSCIKQYKFGFIYWIYYALGLSNLLMNDEAFEPFMGNMGGMWSITYFMIFYVVAIVYYKLIKTMKGSVIFFIIYSVFSHFLIDYIDPSLLQPNIWQSVAKLGVVLLSLSGFFFGMMCYKIYSYSVQLEALVIIALVYTLLRTETLKYVIPYGMIILLFSIKDVNLSEKNKYIINLISKRAFIMYLTHLFIIEVYKNIFNFTISSTKLNLIRIFVLFFSSIIVTEVMFRVSSKLLGIIDNYLKKLIAYAKSE